MTRYADPRRCPDCGRTIVTGAAACAACGLTLSGETAQHLYRTLVQADELLAALRSASTPASAAPAGQRSPVPRQTARRLARPRHGLSAASVPKILLTLGAGCLLVAALVFLAVTWSVLGVGGRTATLVGFTLVAGTLTGWMARRGLRAAAESLGLVGYGLLTLDVVGADHAGWFGDPSTADLLVLLGGLLAVAGASGAVAVRRASTVVLVGAEVVTAVGTGLLALGLMDVDGFTPEAGTLVATLLAATATVLVHRSRLRVAAAGAAVVTTLSWLSLAGLGVARAFEHPGWRGLWLHGRVWPLLAAALVVGALAMVRRLPLVTRVAAAAVAHPLVVLAVLAPALDSDPTALTLLGVAVLVAAAMATRLTPRPWGLSNAATQVVVGAGLAAVVTEAGVRAGVRLVDAAAAGWSGRTGDRLPETLSYVDRPAAWLLPLAVVALAGTGAALAHASIRVDRAVSRGADLRVAAAVLAASLVGALASYPVPLWLVLGALLGAAAVFSGWWRASGSSVPLAPAAAFLLTGLLVSLHAEWLTLVALVVTLGVAGLVHLRARTAALAVVGGVGYATALGAATWTFGAVLDAAPAWVALGGLLSLGVLVLATPYAPPSLWTSRPEVARSGIEAGVALAAPTLGLVGVTGAAHPATWAAAYLTVAGVVVTLMSLLRADRRDIGWLGGGLLAVASWVRLWDVGVQAPEAYTLPSAAALLVVGLVHLRRHPDASTLTALTPGLSLALLPSLLWALDEPVGLRSLLLGLGCLALLLAGVRSRWTAPIASGAAVGALLVVRLAAPYLGDAVPRWVLIGVAGALLVGMGATWERRLREARDVLGYVRALR